MEIHRGHIPDRCADTHNCDRPSAVGADGAGAIIAQKRTDDAHWSLGMALAWITCRTEQAVIDIKRGRWGPTGAALRDLLSALRSGKLIAHGMFEGDRSPHPIETAVWSTFEIIVKRRMFPGRMSLPSSGTPVVLAQRMGSPQIRLLSATVPAAKVKRFWPAARLSVAAATRCRQYLVTEMQRCPERRPKPKSDFLADCRALFPGLGERGFERAWADAIRVTGAVGWSRAGRHRRSSH
jgi:hypothetical protein